MLNIFVDVQQVRYNEGTLNIAQQYQNTAMSIILSEASSQKKQSYEELHSLKATQIHKSSPAGPPIYISAYFWVQICVKTGS